MITCVITLLTVLVLLLIAYIAKGKQILKINTRDLVYKILTDLDYSPTYVEQGFINFIYRDIPFYVEVIEDKATIKILSCYESDVSHIKDKEILHWITHNVNKNNYFKVIPYKIENDCFYFGVCANILLIKQIPKIKGYLMALLELCFKIKDEMQSMINDEEIISLLSNEQVETVKAYC